MKLGQLKFLNGIIAETVKHNLKLGAAEVPKYMKKVESVVYNKAVQVNAWYTRILGLDEVKQHQDRVVALQERLLSAQERRRSIGLQLADVRRKSNELQDQIHKVKRQEDLQRFLNLMKEETEVLKTEQDITQTFNECDREEREIFTAFTNAVRDSHEKQRAQLEYTKYFGLVLSLIGSSLAFFYSTLRKQDLQNFIKENVAITAGSSGAFVNLVQQNEKELQRLSNNINKENLKMIALINRNHKEMMNSVRNQKEMNSVRNHKGIDTITYTNEYSDNQKLAIFGCLIVAGILMLKGLFN